MGIKLSEIKAIDKQSFIKCKYTTKNGYEITKRYSYALLSDAKKDFKKYINKEKENK